MYMLGSTLRFRLRTQRVIVNWLWICTAPYPSVEGKKSIPDSLLVNDFVTFSISCSPVCGTTDLVVVYAAWMASFRTSRVSLTRHTSLKQKRLVNKSNTLTVSLCAMLSFLNPFLPPFQLQSSCISGENLANRISVCVCVYVCIHKSLWVCDLPFYKTRKGTPSSLNPAYHTEA